MRVSLRVCLFVRPVRTGGAKNFHLGGYSLGAEDGSRQWGPGRSPNGYRDEVP